jgi:DnaK suppressor protein
MPGKKAAKTGKPAKKAAARKAPAARKVARPARKTRPAVARAKPARQSRTKPQKAARPAVATRPAVAARPAAKAASPRAPAILKPKPPAPIAQVAEGRPMLAAIALRTPARRSGGDEEEEGAGHNLLLGPRNVRPYRERKGEQYMSRDQLDHFRGILSNWKRDLMEEVDRTMSHMKDEAANPPDPNDRATLESEFALELRTRDRERKLIRKIEEALSRIDDGSYGYCVETGEPIGVKRLEARPVATLCIEAQERRERREKQYGDRDDWYR